MIPGLVNGFAAALTAALLAQAEVVVPPLSGETPTAAPAPAGTPAAAEPAGVLTRPPELIEFLSAPYPPEAEAAGIAGQVLFAVVIGEDGTVGAVRVLDAGPHSSFAPAAEAAVRKFRFRPAEIDGKPATVEIEYRYDFVLQKKVAPIVT
jgi:TonB family protein